MTPEEAQKKIKTQTIIIERLSASIKKKNETIEQLGEILRQLELELAKYKINHEAAKEGISPLIHTGSNVKHVKHKEK